MEPIEGVSEPVTDDEPERTEEDEEQMFEQIKTMLGG